MHAAADRAAPDKSTKDERGTATTAKNFQPPARNRSLSEAAAVSLGDKLHQVSAFGKGSGASGMAASTIVHDNCSLLKDADI